MATRNTMYRWLHNSWIAVFAAGMAAMFFVWDDLRTVVGLTVAAYALAGLVWAFWTRACKCASCGGFLYAPRGRQTWAASNSLWIAKRCKHCGHELDQTVPQS